MFARAQANRSTTKEAQRSATCHGCDSFLLVRVHWESTESNLLGRMNRTGRRSGLLQHFVGNGFHPSPNSPFAEKLFPGLQYRARAPQSHGEHPLRILAR